jgi:hypothetical protein
MLKPICVPCHRFYRSEKNGVRFTEGMPVGPDRAAPGLSEPEKWKPYKVWQGDKWKCQGCGAEIIVGAAQRPIAEHYQDGFAETAERLGADKYQVNDC